MRNIKNTRLIAIAVLIISMFMVPLAVSAESPSQEVLIDRLITLLKTAPEDTIIWEPLEEDQPEPFAVPLDIYAKPGAEDIPQEEALRAALAAVLDLNPNLSIDDINNSFQITFSFYTDASETQRFWVISIVTGPGKLGTDAFHVTVSSPEGRVIAYDVIVS